MWYSKYSPIPAFSPAIQIHFTGHDHWVTSTYLGQDVQIYDSSVGRRSKLTSSLEEQLSQIYTVAIRSGGLTVKQMPVQQQGNYRDCGVYSIAYAYHAALGDNLTCLQFDSALMRKHLIYCFTMEEFSPFPTKEGQISKRCTERKIFIPVYCLCSLPESYDKEMILCDTCEEWYHFKCVNIRNAPDNWTCPKCIWTYTCMFLLCIIVTYSFETTDFGRGHCK